MATSAENKDFEAEKKIAQLEQDFFNLSKQLDNTNNTVKELNLKNDDLKGFIKNEKLDKNKLIQTLEKSRDDLIIERTSLQTANNTLQNQKDSLETETAKLLKENQRLLDEIESVKSDFYEFKNQQNLIQTKLDEFESEKKLIEADKDRWNREKEIVLQTKQWYLDEIASRENKINDLRIETLKLQAINEERAKLETNVNDFKEELVKKDEEIMKLRERLQEIVEERATTLNEMDAELRTKERLAQVYRSSLDAANNEIEAIKESENELNSKLQEKEMVIANQLSQIEQIQAEHQQHINEKLNEIKNLEHELTKANELLKMGTKIHPTDNELATISPAAAAAASLVKSGLSLTSIYAEHCRVVSELEKQREENERIERYELDEKAPLLREQREVYDNLEQQVRSLVYQNELISKKCQELQNERDTASRELTFTKAELIRYQEEHHVLSIRRLLFVIEKGDSSTPYEDDEISPYNSDFLFSNIRELQEKNIELLSKIKGFEDDKYKTIMEYQNTE